MLFAVVAVASCADAPSAAVKPLAGGSRPARLAVEPVFAADARAAAARLTDFGIDFDHVRVVIVRPPRDTVKDTTIVFRPGQADVTLDLTVDVRADRESFQAAIDYTNPSGVVFHGEGTVQSYPSDAPPPAPQPITVHYAGPGASVTRITLSPKTSTVFAPGSVTFTVAAFDANNASTAAPPINWSTSDPSVATISNSGTLTTTGKRGTVTITATTPTNATDNASVTVSLPTSGIVLVSGGGQTGKVGAALDQPAVVRVVASDGVGVPNATVVFGAPAGGKSAPSSVLTNASGTASATLTLGGAVGPQSFAAVAGAFSTSIPATATPGDPAALAAVSGGSQLDTILHTLKAPLVVKVADKFGNPVPDVSVDWARSRASGSLSAATSLTGSDGQASIRYALGNVAGSDTVIASVSGVSGSVVFSEQAVAGAPAVITTTSGNGQTARILTALAPFVIRVTDNNNNPVTGATVTWTATNGTLNPTTITDATGTTSNTMTVGGVAGTATATATIGTQSIKFTVTVQTGVVAKLVFQVGPPASSPAGVVIAPPLQVALQDAGGNLTASTNAVSISLGTNPTGGTLTGTLTQNAVAGIATFGDLMISKVGSGYTLVITSANAGRTTSAAFDITPGLASVTPAAVDAVFTDVPFTLTGTDFVIGGTTVAVTGGQVVPTGVVVRSAVSLDGSFTIAGGAGTSTETITITTAFGTSNGLSLVVGGVGGAPLQLGAANGGGGGTPYSLDCPVGAIATGLNVRGGANVDNIQVICQTVTGAQRTFGAATFTGSAGGGGGSPVTLACPANYVLVGLTGRIGNGGSGLNDEITGICSPLNGGQTVNTGTVGSNFSGSIGYTATCPVGLAVSGIQGGAGNLVDRTQIKCR